MKLIGFFTASKIRAFLSLGVVLSLAALGVGTGQTSAYNGPIDGGQSPAVGRIIRAVSTNATAGSQVTVSIDLDSQGNEVATSFTVLFDQTKLTNPVITLGNGVPAGMALTVNPNQVSSGRLGLLVDSANSFLAGPPSRQVVRITFNVAAGAAIGPSTISFGSSPTPRSTSDPLGQLLTTAYEDGTVTIATAAASFEVSGRVTTPTGQGLRNAVVTIIDPSGVRRTALTTSFGFYSFDNVAGNQTHTLTVSSKRYRFASQVVSVTENLFNVDFTAQE